MPADAIAEIQPYGDEVFDMSLKKQQDPEKKTTFGRWGVPEDGRGGCHGHPQSNSNDHSQSDSDDFPDGGYGWVVVFASFWLNACAWGSSLAYSAVGGLSFGAGLLFSPLIVYFVGLFNVHVVVFLGAVLEFAGMMLASFSTKMWQLYLTQGLLVGFGLAFICTFTPSITPQWFSKKRSFAMGVCASGSGVGGIIFNLAMQRIIDIKSVQWALRSQAIIVLFTVSVCSILLRTRQKKIKPQFRAWDALVASSFPFWMQLAWVVFTILGYAVLQYVIADASKSLGYTAKQGSITSAIMAVGVTVGRPALGFVSDRVGAIVVGVAVYAVCGILCLAMWIPARNLATMYAFAFFEGALMGYIWGAQGAIIPRITGLQKAPVAFGMSFIFIGAAAIVSPIIGLKLRQDSSTEASSQTIRSPTQYQYLAVFTGLCFLVAALCLFVLRGYIIARDMMAEQEAKRSAEQGEQRLPNPDGVRELHMTVPGSLVVKNLLVMRPKKKV